MKNGQSGHSRKVAQEPGIAGDTYTSRENTEGIARVGFR